MMAPRSGLTALLCTTALLLGACASRPDAPQRAAQAQQLAGAGQWRAQVLEAGRFRLLSYAPQQARQVDTLTVYLEGDGLAWLSRDQVSPDPTPVHPLALRLALAQADGAAAYLARPCQYGPLTGVPPGDCQVRYWTTHRFAPDVVEASSRALDQLKAQAGARRLRLVGYSGGAAVAALVAARRQDVTLLVTVAGNLDHRAWTLHHRVSPLTGSLNPADERASLADVAQVHFAGEADEVIPPALIAGFVHGLPARARAAYRPVPGASHGSGWVERWPALLDAAAPPR